MPSNIKPKKSPVRAATKSTAASLLGTLSADEVKVVLHLRALDNDYQEMLKKLVQNMSEQFSVKLRPTLSIVRRVEALK
jgi:predicted ATPase